MIVANNITKRFENHTALDKVTMKIERGCIYGLVGTNGSGKSTMLRLISGVYYPNSGAVSIDDQPVFENPDAKQRVFFVSDDLFFPPQATLDGMAEFYRAAYPNWSNERYQKLCELFLGACFPRVKIFFAVPTHKRGMFFYKLVMMLKRQISFIHYWNLLFNAIFQVLICVN